MWCILFLRSPPYGCVDSCKEATQKGFALPSGRDGFGGKTVWYNQNSFLSALFTLHHSTTPPLSI